MKILLKVISLLCACCLMLGMLAGCSETDPGTTEQPVSTGDVLPVDPVDYVAEMKLNMKSYTLKQEVTVKAFIDGDTTHFNVPADMMPEGVLKARYLGVDTPESTGRVEEYGKTAATFTKEKLQSASSIILESDTNTWNLDSTGGRYLVWVWYKPQGSDDYRNLNLELLQNGLAFPKSSANTQYGTICTKAIDQARAMKLHVYSGKPDPNFYYGEAVEMTLKELRANMESYNLIKVAFSANVVAKDGNSVYLEYYDPETDMYYGITAYLGTNPYGNVLDILTVGNEVRVVGKVQYYETGGTWQISGLAYDPFAADSPEYIKKLGDGKEPANRLTTAETFVNGKVEIEVDGQMQSFDYAAMAMDTSIVMEKLTVIDAYATESGDSAGAMTLTCEQDGVLVYVRTEVFRDDKGELITPETYLGKVIDIQGVVDYYNGNYQIRIFNSNNITVH